MILVDSSAWVEFDRATGSPVNRRVRDLLREPVRAAVTEPVVMEVLAGATSDRRADDLRALLGTAQLLRVDPVADFEAASTIYRMCRQAGVTPRGLLGSLIVAVAQRCDVSLLAHDADMRRMAAVVALRLDDP